MSTIADPPPATRAAAAHTASGGLAGPPADDNPNGRVHGHPAGSPGTGQGAPTRLAADDRRVHTTRSWPS
ncbi:hypothetical protein [Dactylosporangium sp. CA-139066]|uniref:hypothetical protein n=1 Tax=Dactylosporangium sp. CA-139066 TaxID=3239930 RepID=UPI003D8C38A3